MYTKLYSTILDSSIWSSSDSTRIVWITMLAMATRNGIVHASIDGLARRANVPLEKVREALYELSHPDPQDKSGVRDGRRIEAMQGCWQIVNFDFYRETKSIDAVRKQQWRDRKRSPDVQDTPTMSRTVLDKVPSSSSNSAPAPAPAPTPAPAGSRERDAPSEPAPAAKAAPKPRKPRTVTTLLPEDFAPNAEHATIAKERGLDLGEVFAKFRDWCAANGSRKADWNATLRNWLRAERPRHGAPRGHQTDRVSSLFERARNMPDE